MAHTLVGSASRTEWPWVQNPVGAVCWSTGRLKDSMGNFLFCFFCFFSVLILSNLLGDPRESRGDAAFPPTCGPALILSPLLGTPENAGVM